MADEQRRQADAAQQLQGGVARCRELAGAKGAAAAALLHSGAVALLQLLDSFLLPGDLVPAPEGEQWRH